MFMCIRVHCSVCIYIYTLFVIMYDYVTLYTIFVYVYETLPLWILWGPQSPTEHHLRRSERQVRW